jgi:hypothetical protein
MSDTETPAPAPAAGNQQVQLGIGTLVIIALIVTMCSGKGETEKLQKDTAELKRQVGEVNRKLDVLIAIDAAPPNATVEAPDANADTARSP